MQDIITISREFSSIGGSGFGYCKMPKKFTNSEIEVVEVYDLAISIGKEFEKISLKYGNDSISKLMPQVITALEYLELLADIRQRVTDDYNELKRTVERLQTEKLKRSSLKDQYDKEIYLLEHTSQVERDEFNRNVELLQHRNDDLQRSLDQYKRTSTISTCSNDSSSDGQQDLTRLRGVVTRQTDDLRYLKRECRQKSIEIQGLNKEIDQLEIDNASSKQKSHLSLEQTNQLLEDKVELRSQLERKELEILNISTLLGHSSSPRPCDDDNRPQFTLNELRDVLAERNDLKSRLFDLDTDTDTSSTYGESEPISLHGELQNAEDDFCRSTGDNDLPVQGPINKEPRDKLNPNESLMKRLFQRFLEKIDLPTEVISM